MGKMKISLIHASYKSIQQSKAVRDYWLESATHPEFIEHCLGFEFDDQETRQGYGLPHDAPSGKSPDQLTNFMTTPVTSGVSAVSNWNAAASISTGNLLLVIADDLIPEKSWDQDILTMLEECDLRKPLILKFTDFRCSDSQKYPFGDIYLPRHPLVNRAFVQENGFLFNPSFEGIGADDDLLLYGISKEILRDSRSVKFHHSIGQVLNENGDPNCGCTGDESTREKTISQIAIHRDKIDSQAIFSKKYSKLELLKYKVSCNPHLVSAIRLKQDCRSGMGQEIKFKGVPWLLAILIGQKALRLLKK
jgi:hypothetical protein